MPTANPSLLCAIAIVFTALACGSVVRIVALRGRPADLAQPRFASLKTWWVLASLVALAAVFAPIGVAILLATSAAIALREFVTLVGRQNVGTPTIATVLLAVPAYYAFALFGNQELLQESAPAVFVVTLCGMRACLGTTQGYLRTTAAMLWALLLFVYCLSHAFFLYELPTAVEPSVGHVGWFLFLILLTETNDILQAITGRRFGKTKITPRVSPNKSLEGLLGGIAATMILSAIAAPWLTTLTAGRSASAAILISLSCGLMVSLAGFLGDINMSAIKRDVGVKDGSTLLPGQGGMIDRIDSLTFTAPVFYFFVRIVMKVTHE